MLLYLYKVQIMNFECLAIACYKFFRCKRKANVTVFDAEIKSENFLKTIFLYNKCSHFILHFTRISSLKMKCL
jgi:hypothetical protein